jgi:nucleoside 2-deoxyribosyltransferase
MVHKTVYLAGPIDGLTYGEATRWRNKFRDDLSYHGIKAVDPMRSQTYLAEIEGPLTSCKIAASVAENKSTLTASHITAADKFDCTNCSFIIVNVLGAKKVSIGTMIEVGWANANNIPIILVIEEEGNVHEHPILDECSGFRVDDLEKAKELIIELLSAY